MLKRLILLRILILATFVTSIFTTTISTPNKVQLDHLPYHHYISQTFSNWAETFKTNYSSILYPTDYSPDQQIAKIQQFVKKGAQDGKRVRGAGNRVSYSAIFSDPEELMVSFYPKSIAEGSSKDLQTYSQQMTQLEEQLSAQNIEHLAAIRKVGEIYQNVTKDGQQTIVKKHLIRIGAGVSNNQLRIWSKRNGYQCKSNVVVVQINFVGALCTCSHGSGKDTQTLADYVHSIEFIDHKGNRQVISKSSHPQLIESAAGSLGLLGLVIFVTIEMEDLQIVKLQPVNRYKDVLIPWPKDYTGKEKRQQTPQWKKFIETEKPTSRDLDWNINFKAFKEALNLTFNEWLYFLAFGEHIMGNNFNAYSLKTQENIDKLIEEGNIFLQQYPQQQNTTERAHSFPIQDENTELITQNLITILLKNPFQYLPKIKDKESCHDCGHNHLALPFKASSNQNIFVNYPDAVHFNRGGQDLKIRDFAALINIPIVNNSGIMEPDYDLIQRIWWAGQEIAEKNRDVINKGVEMRILKGSQATLAPTKGYDYACSIEIIRNLTTTDKQEQKWINAIISAFNAWKNLKDRDGNLLTIRPHWGKEWNNIPLVKQHVLDDESLKANIRKFLNDYKAIAELKGFDYMKNLQTFSNQLYREMLNNAMQKDEQKIK